MDNKILLREHHLKVGTVFKTVNRFHPDKDWIIHKIEKLNLEKNTAELSVLGWHQEYLDIDYTKYHPTKGTTTMFTHPIEHTKHSKTTWIDYYIPAGNILYGRK